MLPEKQIEEFIKRMREAAGQNLESVVLYGSAATGDFHPDFSNVNLLLVVKDSSSRALAALAEPMAWWHRQKRHEPLVLTGQELERSTDVFSIEMIDMQQRHKVLFGSDPLRDLKIPMALHRAQIEYEMREKLILLRQRFLLVANDKKRVWELMLGSVSAFATLFRHALLEMGQSLPQTKREAVQALAASTGVDASAFLQVLDVREHKIDRKQLDAMEVFAKYLLAVEQATAAVDRMPEASGK
jgi:hypothetical protein